MLIDLADDLGDRLDELCAKPGHAHALRCLALAHHEGKHFVTGNRGVFTALARERRLDEHTRTVFRTIERTIHNGHQLRQQIRVLARVNAEPSAAPRLVVANNQKIFRVALGELTDSSRVQRTVMLGENLEDAKMFCAAAAAFLQRARLEKLSIAFAPKLGGGQTTATVFESEAASAPVVCVVDGDFAAANAPLGGTARAVQQTRDRLHRRDDFVVADAHVLEQCRELENLLPARLVLDALAGVPDVLPLAVQADKRTQLGQGDHVDLKKALAGHAEREGEVEFLAHVTAFVAKLSPNKLAEYLFQGPLGTRWEALTEVLFAWGCAPRRAHVV